MTHIRFNKDRTDAACTACAIKVAQLEAADPEALGRAGHLYLAQLENGAKKDGAPPAGAVLDVQAVLKRAMDLFGKKKFGESIRLLNKAMEKAPNSPELNSLLADCYYELGQYDKARQGYHSVLKMGSPEKTRIYYRLALSLQKTGMIDEMMMIMQMASDDIYRSPELCELWSNAFYGAQRSDAAIDVLRQCVDRNPLSPGLHLRLGAVLAEQGRDEEAWLEFDETLLLDSGNKEALKLSGAIKKKMTSVVASFPGDIFRDINRAGVAEERKMDRITRELAGKSIEEKLSVAGALLWNSRAFDVIKLLEADAGEYAGNPRFNLTLGRAYLDVLRLDNAVDMFEKVLKVEPRNADADALLKRATVRKAGLLRSEDFKQASPALELLPENK